MPARPVRGADHPGDRHLFADASLPSYDTEAASLLTERVLALLAE